MALSSSIFIGKAEHDKEGKEKQAIESLIGPILLLGLVAALIHNFSLALFLIK